MGLIYGRPPSPCKDCKERSAGCHAECEKYKVFADENRRRHDEAMNEYEIHRRTKTDNAQGSQEVWR